MEESLSNDGLKGALLTCPKCNYQTSYPSDMRLHLNISHIENSYTCNWCPFRTPWREILFEHLRKHASALLLTPSPKYEDSQEPLTPEVRDDSNSKIGEILTCPKCSYQTTRPAGLKLHLGSKHAEEKAYSCRECGFQTAWRASLQQHLLGKHSVGLEPIACSECDYTTTRPANLQRHHLSRHTSDPEKKRLGCHFCDYRTSCSKTLKQHLMSRHTGERPHACPECDYSAVQAGVLKKHIMARHSKERPYHCIHCDYVAVRGVHLQRHLWKKHHFPADPSAPDLAKIQHFMS